MLHKIKALLLLAVLFPILAQAQFTLTGKIIDDHTQETLPGAHLQLSGKLTIADRNGNFKFDNLTSGTYVLEVSFMGYSKHQQTIRLNTNQKIEVKLSISPIMEDAVVIVANRASEQTGTSFSNLGKVEIKKADIGMDLPYILDMTPGLLTNSDAGAGVGYTSMRIRGSDLTRINVTINGIPLNDPESQGAWFVDLPDLASSLNSIQVQRGVGTSVNGPAAFGASIDLQTNGLETDPSGEIGFSFGSFNTKRYRMAASTGLLNDKYTFDVRMSKISSDGFIDRASADLKSFFISGARYGKNNILRFNIISGNERTYQAWSGVPKDSLATNRTLNPYTYKNEVDDYTQTHYQLHFSQKIGKRWIVNSALHYTRGLGYYENYKTDVGLDGYGLANIIIGTDTISHTDLIQQKWLDNDFYGLTADANYSSKNWKIIIGGAVNQYQGSHYGEIIWAEYGFMGKDYEWYRNKGLKTDMNIFTKATWFASTKFNIYGDLQYRLVNYSMDGFHDDLHDLTSSYNFNFVNPKIGTLYRFNEAHQIHGSMAIANKEPSRNNFRDADAGNIPVSEQLTDYELGYSFQNKKSFAHFNFYYMNYSNQLVETGKVNNVGSPIMINVDKSYRVGAEFIAGWQPSEKFNWNFNITISQNKIIGFTEYVDNWDSWTQESAYLGTTDIAFSPNAILKNSFNFKPISNLEISILSRYVSRQFIDNTSNLNRSIDPYFVSDLNFGFNPKIKWFKNLNLNFRINNILNENYESSAWVYRYRTRGNEYVMDGYFPQAGTNFMGGITVKF